MTRVQTLCHCWEAKDSFEQVDARRQMSAIL
jgi:hypothetical protein